MPRFIELPTIVKAAGNKPKQIEEFVGRVNTGDESISVARMVSPGGWVEPAQSPEFQEMSVVLKGVLHVETKQGIFEVKTGQAMILDAGEWVRYSTPGDAGAEYIAICLPAFSPETVHRESDD